VGGTWREIVNTDAEHYGGTNVGNLGRIDADAGPLHGRSHSATITLPPLGTLWLAPASDSG
jgi:1,4-alpha-glucan branching enzyme